MLYELQSQLPNLRWFMTNGCDASPEARALLAGVAPDGAAPSPVFVAHQRRVEHLVHDGARLPAALGAPLLGAARAVVDRHLDDRAPTATEEPRPLRPGSLGRFTTDRAAS